MLQKKISGFILDMKQRLGKGVFGEVYLAVDTSNNQIVAVKQVPLNARNTQQNERTYNLIQNEIKIMRSISNPNVVGLLNVQRTANNIYIVMDYCNQGTLEEYITHKCEDKGQKKGSRPKIKHLSEKEALLFMGQIVNGFRALYKQKIVHRDLKLQNILMHDGEAKIADFGFSKMIEFEMEEALLKTYAGSPLYMSIQILKEQQYSSKCDVWSLGVIMYEVIYGQPPWIAVSIPDLIYKIENQKLRLPDRPIVSQETQLLIIRMLTILEQQRIGWEEIFAHPYFNEKMEIEGDLILRQDVMRIEGEYKNDGLRRSNAKKKLYFERNSVIQNANHSAKQQRRMQKIFEMPQEGSPISRQPLNDELQNLSLGTIYSNNSSNSNNTSFQQQTKNKIFEDRRDRSISPRSAQLEPQQDSNYAVIFQKNKAELENKKITQKISDWIIHRRNKSVFLNTVSQKWFDLYDSGVFKDLVNNATYYRFLFVLTKYQTTIFFKMNCRLEQRALEKQYNKQIIQKRSNKFTKQQWYIFTKSVDFKTTANQIKLDFNIVRGFLLELIPRAIETLEQAKKSDQDSYQESLNQHVYSICNMDLIDKQVFDPILQENMSYMLQLVKAIFTKQTQKSLTQEELQSFLYYNKELLVFALHLTNAIRIKEQFKFSSDRPLDFFKYYEEINNETPTRLAQQLGLIK